MNYLAISLMALLEVLPQIGFATTSCENIELVAKIEKIFREAFDHRVDYQRYGLKDLSALMRNDVQSRIEALSPDERVTAASFIQFSVQEGKRTFLTRKLNGSVTPSLAEAHMKVFEAMLDHPLIALVARHEFTHLLRMAPQAYRARLLQILDPREFRVEEEIAASNSDYDFIRQNISQGELNSLIRKLNVIDHKLLLKEAVTLGIAKLSQSGEHSIFLGPAIDLIERDPSQFDFVGDVLAGHLVLSPEVLSYLEKRSSGQRLLDRIVTRVLDITLVDEIKMALTLSRKEYLKQNLARAGLKLPRNEWVTVGMVSLGGGAIIAALITTMSILAGM